MRKYLLFLILNFSCYCKWILFKERKFTTIRMWRCVLWLIEFGRAWTWNWPAWRLFLVSFISSCFSHAVTINWSNKENQIMRCESVNRNTYRKVHTWRWWRTCELVLVLMIFLRKKYVWYLLYRTLLRVGSNILAKKVILSLKSLIYFLCLVCHYTVGVRNV